MKKVLIIAVAVAAAVGLGVWTMSDSKPSAPNVAFTDLNGKTFRTEDLRGKVVLVKFWATDCTTCVAQMPDNIANFNALSGKGFDIVAVAMKHDPINYVRNFTQSRQLPFTVAHDDTGEIAKAFGDVRLTPTAFLLDKQGHVIKRYLGNYDKQEFIATVEKALSSS